MDRIHETAMSIVDAIRQIKIRMRPRQIHHHTKDCHETQF